MAPKLSLLVLRARDIKRLAAFYAALGFWFQEQQHGEGPEHFATVGPGFVLEIYPRGENAPGTTRVRLGFEVKGLQSMLKELERIGGKIISPPSEREGRLSVVIADPEGHKVELTESV